ncbi:MAG: hypothetical protein HYU29_02095 [Chloroflexi bacterium]|nr:hypothetical protein [Chloroflexota bacterium]MBI2850247.1 hypothetical protein [Chloroflexota bacterium]
MPKGIGPNHQWQARTEEVDFLKNEGGHYAVSLTLDMDNAKKLAKDLTLCMKNAQKNKRKRIQIIAHWGRRSPEGFLLRTTAGP